jgi:hypothetical protein
MRKQPEHLEKGSSIFFSCHRRNTNYHKNSSTIGSHELICMRQVLNVTRRPHENVLIHVKGNCCHSELTSSTALPSFSHFSTFFQGLRKVEGIGVVKVEDLNLEENESTHTKYRVVTEERGTSESTRITLVIWTHNRVLGE